VPSHQHAVCPWGPGRRLLLPHVSPLSSAGGTPSV
jgi:hypothetical protein